MLLLFLLPFLITLCYVFLLLALSLFFFVHGYRPHSNVLAVGVIGGLVLWYIDPNLRYTLALLILIYPLYRPTSTFLLCFPGQQPLTTISWCPLGRFLACGCPCNPTLLIWDIHLRTSTPLKVNIVNVSGFTLALFVVLFCLAFWRWGDISPQLVIRWQ